MDRIYNEQGPDKFVPVAWHSSSRGLWYTTEAAQRMGYYGADAYPYGFFDGIMPHRGAYPNEQNYAWYMSSFNIRRAIKAPLTVTFLQKQYGGGKATVKVKVDLEEAITAGHVCHFVLWEDNMSYAGRKYRFVERGFTTKNVTITGKGQNEEFTHEFTIQSGWNKANLGVSVFVQDPTGKEVKNGRAGKLESSYAVNPASVGRVKALFH